MSADIYMNKKSDNCVYGLAYLNAHIPPTAVIETWEPEMGFLTDHNYHFPPQGLLAMAVDQVYYGGAPVQEKYNYLQTESPEYVLVGEFSKWTQIYPSDLLQNKYHIVQSFGDYDLLQRVGP